jgi:hypothetical protein
MNGTNQPATESQLGRLSRSGEQVSHPPIPPKTAAGSASFGVTKPPEQLSDPRPQGIKIAPSFMPGDSSGKSGRTEIFTMTLGSETIPLLPLKSWDQLDVHKWCARGKLPATPAGLEIAVDHVKVTGETVRINDPEGCWKLEKLFNEWLALENATQALARHKPLPASGSGVPVASTRAAHQPPHYQVEFDKRGQVHLHCFHGKTLAASVGLSVQGISSLCSQGLMRRPHAVHIGVLHDWIELDGVRCSFEKGRNEAAKLQQLLNERFIPAASLGQGKEVIVFANAASPTGFDIQFPVSVGGVLDLHRYHLNDESLERLHDPQHCGLLVDGLIVKLIPPTLVFKPQKGANSF